MSADDQQPPEHDAPDPSSGPAGSAPIGDRGLTEAGDAGHAAYVQGKIADAAKSLGREADSVELHSIRNPIDWRNELDKWGNRRELHDAFMYGMQAMQDRTPEAGWVYEYSIKTPLSFRRIDVAQVEKLLGRDRLVHNNEYKAGYVAREEGLLQLQKEEFLLANNLVERSEYTVPSLDLLDPEVAQRAAELEQRFKGRFIVNEVGREVFEQTVAIGKPIVQQNAVEKLRATIEQLRENPTLTVARDAIRNFIAEIEQAREQGEPIPLRVLVAAREDLAELVRVDQRVIQDYDRIAREKARLKISQALLVEQAQAVTRDERTETLFASLGAVDREIDRAAEELAEGARPNTREERDRALEQAQALARNADRQEELDLQRAHARLTYQLQATQETEREAEREALEQAGLGPDHVDEAVRRLDEAREQRDAATRAHLLNVDNHVKTKANARVMGTEIERHNALIERVGGKAANQPTRDPEVIREAVNALRLDPERDSNLNAQVYRAAKEGRVTYERETRQWVMQIDGRQVRVPLESAARQAGEAARLAELGYDPVAIRNMTHIQPAQPDIRDRGPKQPETDVAERGRQAELERRQAKEREGRDR
ncbi:hypothetical protein [Nocardia altamirensis]|uniref:hypothetical protein n=1 Tax=Nocardia altamirensis TaxID=472158 RepID=UPI0008402970|nr:hypothetical protein [Nocardia altamirensis]